MYLKPFYLKTYLQQLNDQYRCPLQQKFSLTVFIHKLI